METLINSLEDLEKILTHPLAGISKNNVVDIQNKFKYIAESLFANFVIQCGEKIFRFAEIEFYYYKTGEWEDDWNKETYQRNNKHANDLFFHYSGVDICFESHFDESKAEFGGILIRSLLDGDNILAGPLYCENILLNSCSNNLPILKLGDHINFILKPTKRCNIKSDQQDSMDLNLCYYAHAIKKGDKEKKLNWENTSIRQEWDKNSKGLKDIYRNYLKDRNF